MSHFWRAESKTRSQERNQDITHAPWTQHRQRGGPPKVHASTWPLDRALHTLHVRTQPSASWGTRKQDCPVLVLLPLGSSSPRRALPEICVWLLTNIYWLRKPRTLVGNNSKVNSQSLSNEKLQQRVVCPLPSVLRYASVTWISSEDKLGSAALKCGNTQKASFRSD